MTETPTSPPWQCRTHISSTIIKALKVWSLVAKLEKNCKIEAENMTRESMTMKHMDDPVLYPDPGSEAVSFVMIEQEELQALHTPSFTEKFLELPMFVQRILASFESKDSDAKKRDANNARLPPEAA
ncbi:hypothetical protein IW261DRAFT_1336583 [Armillaria novae-zelandiae]|uniref:Uncharacterized protein n=1 Tax=Armillaria novae-zelandiae TaxID=153914 RepID=A0AA39UAT1_9AGAR|nr:hypothetical protein IW261DRAFT_1336583 [Armillaria novae-zelandiae]